MPVLISMLRGINVGGHNKIKMDALRALYISLKFENPQTYVQSGNVVFKSKEQDLALIAKRIQQSIEKNFACCPEVILRTADDLRSVIKNNPFARQPNIDPARLLITFLASDPGDPAQFGRGAKNDVGAAGEFLLNGGLDAFGNQVEFAFAGFEDDISALQVGLRVFEFERNVQCTQGVHLDLVVAADVNSAQHGNEDWHRQK